MTPDPTRSHPIRTTERRPARPSIRRTSIHRASIRRPSIRRASTRRASLVGITLGLLLSGLAGGVHAESDGSARDGSAAKAPASGEKAISESYRETIREFVAVQGTAELTGQGIAYGMAEQTLQAIAQSGVEVTEAMQQIVLEEALETFGDRFSDVGYLADLYAPVYAEHFSEAEIREIIAFYRSPVGRKMIELTAPLTQAGSRAIQEATFAVMPGFQLAVDARLREAGMLPAP